MPIGARWVLAELRSEGGLEIARFCVDHRHVLDSSSYTRSVWVDVFAEPNDSLDGFIADLDEIEDRVTAEVESNPGCLLVLTITGANSRTLVFAVGGDVGGLEAKIPAIEAIARGRVEARRFDALRLGPYKQLLQHYGDQI